MRTQTIRSWQLALLLALSVSAFACGDDTGGGADDDVPDLTGNNGEGNNGNNGGSEGENNGESNGVSNDGENNGSNATAGTNAPEDTCVKEPKNSAELLNSCPPAGVERRAFDNEARLPSSYEPGKLPAL